MQPLRPPSIPRKEVFLCAVGLHNEVHSSNLFMAPKGNQIPCQRGFSLNGLRTQFEFEVNLGEISLVRMGIEKFTSGQFPLFRQTGTDEVQWQRSLILLARISCLHFYSLSYPYI